jgi:hypothetical protein
MNASNYKITNVTDRGVYAGPYGWGGVITKPESKAVVATFVAPGGGGGGNASVTGSRVNNHGGSSGGASSTSADPGVVHQLPWLANVSYSSYGYPGGRSSYFNVPGGGGGASFPGRSGTVDSRINEGGLGIEWPYGSQTYYGSGGNSKLQDTSFTNYSLSVVHGAGRGGDGGSAGANGTVIVRYVTAGPYTPPVQFVRTENLMATGGNVSIVNGYKQHTFYTSGVFSICNLPDNAYIDIIAVGGGAGGSASKTSNPNPGGGGGRVSYQRVELNSTSIYNYAVAVGSGGGGGSTTTYGSISYSSGGAGSPSSITLPSYTTVLAKILAAGGATTGNAQPGTLITTGLFSDNTAYYGGSGSDGGGPSYPGGIGGGGSGNGGSGQRGTGGGGGGGVFGNYNYSVVYSPNGYGGYFSYYTYTGGNSTGGDGGSGIVIIRYPYTPI